MNAPWCLSTRQTCCLLRPARTRSHVCRELQSPGHAEYHPPPAAAVGVSDRPEPGSNVVYLWQHICNPWQPPRKPRDFCPPRVELQISRLHGYVREHRRGQGAFASMVRMQKEAAVFRTVLEVDSPSFSAIVRFKNQPFPQEFWVVF